MTFVEMCVYCAFSEPKWVSLNFWWLNKVLSYLISSSSRFPVVGVRQVTHHHAVRLLLLFSSIAHCCFTLPSIFPLSSAFLRSLFRQSSHLSCGLPHFLQPPCFFVSVLFNNLSSFILTMCPVHLIRLLTIMPTSIPIYSLRYFIVLLSTLFILAILLIQLFSHTCSSLGD